MNRFFMILAACITLAATQQSCTSKPKQGEQTAQASAQIKTANVLEIDELLDKAGELAGKEVEAEGICTHICKHGGGKIFLMGSDDTKTIRIEAGKEFGKFKPETVNNVVRVKGMLAEQRIDEAYLIQWEEQVKAKTEEKHGDDAAAGCSTEQKARGEAPANNMKERIDNFRKRIAERKAKDGKEYLSFYHINATEYTIQ